MTARKKLAVLAVALVLAAGCMFTGCTGSGGSDGAAGSVPQSEAAAESAEAAETSSAAQDSADTSATTDVDDDTPFIGEQIEVLEDDEDVDETLDEQYSDFTDADVSLPIIP